MEIKIKNCNNIDEGKIEIEENNLNIKYAINGTGKTSISKSIIASISDKNNSTKELIKLKPFKYIGQTDSNPEVFGCENIKKVKVFNEEYIKEYIFKPDELLKGSFDIFIRDEEYEKGIKEIDDLMIDIQKMFAENKEIDELIFDFNEISNSFGKTTKAGIHASSNLSKAFKNGNKVENIPDELLDYQEYIRHNENYKWIKWQIDGKNYLNISDKCPYCITNIKEKKKKIAKITDTYDPKSVENMNKIIEVFQRLNRYFSENTREVIDSFIKNINGYSNEHENYLREIRDQIDRLNEKFISVKNISFKSLKDVNKVIEEIGKYNIDLNLYNHLQSENTVSKVNVVNNSLKNILDKAGILQGKVINQKKYIEKLVENNKMNINSFLASAGYKYSVDLIENKEGSLQLKLIHNDINNEVGEVETRLSFGEKNAFALVLFMFDVLKSIPELIILDDPISSFDKNKKYAIIDMLFRREKSLKNKTVLLFTHDFEPIVDMLYHHRDRFKIPKASFLENSNGYLEERTIERYDISTFVEINNKNIEEISSTINRLVYLRRMYELQNNKGMGYQVLSSVFHKKEIPKFTDGKNLSFCEIKKGIKEIKEKISDFVYSDILREMKNDLRMKELYINSDNNYEKLHIYRIIFDDKIDEIESNVIQKFINQAFHIENDYIYQLNPKKYQTVPQYVIDECNKYIDRITGE